VDHLQPFVWSEIEQAGVTVRVITKADSGRFSDGSGPRLTGADERREHDVAWHRFLEAPISQLVFAEANVARGCVGHIDGSIKTGVRAGREIRRYLTSAWSITVGEGGRR
jgi:hypothetical protein